MESLFKNLKEHVTCSICLDTYTEPKTIACLHTFCCECLKKHALMSEKGGKFRCPECNAEIAVPEAKRFDKLPTSFHHNSLLGLLAVRQSGDGSEISCGLCKKSSVEISYCFDCEKLMCSDCKNAHEVFRSAGFQGHKVTPVKQFQAQDYEAMLKRQAFCSEQFHEREPTRFFCTECQTCVCQICIATNHKTHEVEPLDKAAAGEKANILARAELIKQKSNVCSDAIHKTEETAAKLETNIASTKREVSQAADQMVAKIRERERENITALENTRVARAEKLNSTKKQVQSLAKQLDQAVEFTNNLVQRSSSSDIMQSKKTLELRFEDLDKTQIPILPVSSFVKFVPTCDPENFSLGLVKTDRLDRSTVEGITQDFQAGVEGELVIRPRIHEEEEVAGVKCKFNVEVLMEPTEKVSSLIVCDQEDGHIPVKFTPKVPGRLKIFVKINGEELATSPLTVQVKERLIQVVGELDLKGEIPQRPRGIAVNSKGLMAVGDCERNCIMIFDKEGRYVQKLGSHGNNAGEFNCPGYVTFINDDEILVVEEFNHRIQQLNVHTGNIIKSFGRNGTENGEFANPTSLCVGGEGHFVVAEFNNHRVQVLSEDGDPVFKFGDSGPEKLANPITCIYYRNTFIVSESSTNCLKVFDRTGKFLYKIGGDGQLNYPWGLCIEKCGTHQNILVCNFNNGHVYQFTMEGCFTGKTVANLQKPTTITTTPDGHILVCDDKAKKIYALK